jgi:hypothetical protein
MYFNFTLALIHLPVLFTNNTSKRGKEVISIDFTHSLHQVVMAY